MQHRGELLAKAIKESGIPVTRIVSSMKRSRRWLYNQFARTDVPLDVFVEIGKIIRHDFSADIQELRKRTEHAASFNDSGETPYPAENAQFWKDKYLRLLEDYTELLKSKNIST